jgi:hypothetical protein
MVEPPAFITSHWQGCKEVLHAGGKLRVAGCRTLHLKQFAWKPAEVVDRFRGGTDRHGSVLNVPVRRDAQNRFGSWEACSDCRPCFRVLVTGQGVHGVAVPEESGNTPPELLPSDSNNYLVDNDLREIV